MIKLTDTMREKLLTTGRYIGARAYYTYSDATKTVFKYNRKGDTLIEGQHIDLVRWKMVKDYDKKLHLASVYGEVQK